MKKHIKNIISIGILAASFLPTMPILAENYPPALNFDDFIEAVSVGTSDSKLYFARKVLSVHVYVPGRNVQVRTDIVDANGTILNSTEHMHEYKNGQALGDIDSSVQGCLNRDCIHGKNSTVLAPGLYWMVFSENGKPFSAEWFEVRSYKLGEGRFAKGEVTYAYLPQTQMARLYFNSSGDFVAEAGFAGENAVGDQSSVTKGLHVTLKHNGKLFAKNPGKMPQNITLYPYTSMESLPMSKAANNGVIKKADMKDGNYELELKLEGKLYRKFSFQIKGGKFVYQGRQKTDTKPPERMIVSESSAWLWNTLSKEPTRTLPAIDLSQLPTPAQD
jgi:hypothetical protein